MTRGAIPGLACAVWLLAGAAGAAGAGDAVRPATPPSKGVPAGAAADPAGDPLEPFNRAMFTFNERFDEYLLKPAATGWDYVLPRPVERGVANFFDNLRFPIRFVNELLQGSIDPAAITLCRFVVNTTAGVAGFVDVAASLDLPAQEGDFGQTLGRWGVPGGPYIVWPVFGSSNPRDSVGLAADSYLSIYTFFVSFYYLAGGRVIDTVNGRALVLDEVSSARDASFDFYAAVRSAYEQRRAVLIRGTAARAPEEEEELYFPDYSGQELMP